MALSRLKPSDFEQGCWRIPPSLHCKIHSQLLDPIQSWETKGRPGPQHYFMTMAALTNRSWAFSAHYLVSSGARQIIPEDKLGGGCAMIIAHRHRPALPGLERMELRLPVSAALQKIGEVQGSVGGDFAPHRQSLAINGWLSRR